MKVPRRKPGSGCIQRAGAGWRWSRRVNGRQVVGRTKPTQAEAAAELARIMADPTFVPEATHPRRQNGRGPKPRHGSPAVKYKAAVQKAALRMVARQPDPDEAPAPTDAEVDAAERTVPRWGKRGADGKRRCLPCKGTGIDGRPGPGAGRACLNCWAEGQEP